MKDTKTITPIDWDFVVETIENEKCVLFIGPDAFFIEYEFGLENQIDLVLDVEKNDDIRSFYSDEGLFLFDSGAKKTKTYYKLKQFYSKSFPKLETFFEKIAKIPIHLIINLSPDLTLSKTMDNLGYSYNFSYYWKNKSGSPLFFKPRKDRPTVYNLLGNIEQQESLVLSHTDLFEYLESVFSGAHFPEQLKSQIKKAHNFIFLGVPFQRWYMQLLLRVLSIHNDYDFVKYASSQLIDSEIRTFCSEQFNIEFVPNNLENFIDLLLEKCEEKGILKQPTKERTLPLKVAKEYLVEDKIERCINLLLEFTETTGIEDFQEDTIFISTKFKRLKKRIITGVISQENADVSHNKIKKQLLQIIHEMESLNN